MNHLSELLIEVKSLGFLVVFLTIFPIHAMEQIASEEPRSTVRHSASVGPMTQASTRSHRATRFGPGRISTGLALIEESEELDIDSIRIAALQAQIDRLLCELTATYTVIRKEVYYIIVRRYNAAVEAKNIKDLETLLRKLQDPSQVQEFCVAQEGVSAFSGSAQLDVPREQSVDMAKLTRLFKAVKDYFDQSAQFPGLEQASKEQKERADRAYRDKKLDEIIKMCEEVGINTEEADQASKCMNCLIL